jgi:8-oxo-dGTP pyrophosphatase MutT (NUDIX family)
MNEGAGRVVGRMVDSDAGRVACMPDNRGAVVAQLVVARTEIVAAESSRSDDPGPDGSIEEARRAMLAFCDAHPDALERRCLAGHLTGSALVVEPTSRQVLLLHHAKLRRWLQPGGHADGEGDLGRVALREATEETGLEGLRLVRPAIDLDIHEIPARSDEPAHLHLDVRYLVLAPILDHRINAESTAARWLDPGAVGAETHTRDLDRLVAAGLRRLDSL